MNINAEEYLILHAALAQKMNKVVDGKLSLHGISFTEFLILHHLNGAQNNTLRRIELADLVGITASGVTRLLAPMEKIKLIEKEQNPRDARVSLVKLSTPGAKLYKNAKISFAEVATKLTEPLSEYDLTRLIQLCQTL